MAGVVLALVLLATPALVLSSLAATSGFLEICKAADGTGVSGTYAFTVAGQTVEVPVGACSAPIQLAPGTVTVTEVARPGTVVTGIHTSPSGRLVSTDPDGRTAQVTVVAGDVSTQTIVTFANRAETGQLKVCKVAGSGVATGTIFAFHAAGQTFTVPAGPAPGGSCTIAGTFPVGTEVTVSEAVPAGLEVSAITVAPPDRAVAPPSPAAGSAAVSVGPGVTEVTFTNRQAVTVPQGFLRICKRADGPAVAGSFTFTVAGQVVDVAVNGCSPVLQLPAGTVTVTEAPRAGTVLAGVDVQPASRLVGSDLAARHARVAVVSGDLGTQTVVTFVNRAELGQLKVCKVAGPGVAVGSEFDFTAAGVTITVPAGPAPGGFCVLGGTFPTGTTVTVSETVPAGLEVSAIAVAPSERAAGPADLTRATQMATIGSGVTEVTFTNRQPSRGFLRVCKRSEGPGLTGTFTFTVDGQIVDVAVNSCTPLLEVPVGTVTVTETSRPGSVVTAIDVAPPDRRAGTDVAGRSVDVDVDPGDAGTRVGHGPVLVAPPEVRFSNPSQPRANQGTVRPTVDAEDHPTTRYRLPPQGACRSTSAQAARPSNPAPHRRGGARSGPPANASLLAHARPADPRRRPYSLEGRRGGCLSRRPLGPASGPRGRPAPGPGNRTLSSRRGEVLVPRDVTRPVPSCPTRQEVVEDLVRREREGDSADAVSAALAYLQRIGRARRADRNQWQLVPYVPEP